MSSEDTVTYGVSKRERVESPVDSVVEQVRTLGWGVLESNFSEIKIKKIALEFDNFQKEYRSRYRLGSLEEKNEQNILRSPLSFGKQLFVDVALNKNVIAVCRSLIGVDFLLNQQNGVINPPNGPYSQRRWHRDLPYQHFVSSRPLAVTALYCIDEFSTDSGGTEVVPASHKSEKFPSSEILKYAVCPRVAAGSFLILDSMVFHRAANNPSSRIRRAINNVYTIPLIRRQISYSLTSKQIRLSASQRALLGIDVREFKTVREFLSGRSDVKK